MDDREYYDPLDYVVEFLQEKLNEAHHKAKSQNITNGNPAQGQQELIAALMPMMANLRDWTDELEAQIKKHKHANRVWDDYH